MTRSQKVELEYRDGHPSVLRSITNWHKLNFYKRSEIVYQLTVAFCRRFLPHHGDRTVDQMVQAARSTKQNIIEGYSDGQTSFEKELKLLGVTRGSNQELLADFCDYLKAHGLVEWKGASPRFEPLYHYCREHTALSDFQVFFGSWKDEEMANCAICLAHMIDKGLETMIKKKDTEFVTQGGIRERMTAARLGYRTEQREQIKQLESENAALKTELERLRKLVEK
ncbi:MAG: four helix bundle suffix domain-containing protein [Victivallales bacterium]|nr:four helix bundle suffix domain-containing protein [Victivallales bacterium]